MKCGNKLCTNDVARVDELCGKLISATDDKCDYVNYSSPKSVYLLSLVYLPSSVPVKLKQQIFDEEEINVDLTGLSSIKDTEKFLSQSPEIGPIYSMGRK